MERDLVFGVVAQLLERRVFGADDDERARLLAGPARLAAAALQPGGATAIRSTSGERSTTACTG